MKNRARAAIAAAALAVAAILTAASVDEKIPAAPDRYVTDRAGVFSPDRAQALNSRLEQFERDTSDQILVWIDRRILDGFTLEDFTVRAAQKWRVGQKGKDNGVVLFVFVDDRKMRIEVGYGLEGVLPDITARRIQEEEILPRFRTGDYAGGVEAGTAAIMAAIKGEYKGTGSTTAERTSGRGASGSTSGCLWALFIFIFFVLPIFSRIFRVGRTYGGGWWTGGGWGGGGGGGGGFSGGGFSGGGGSFGGGGSSGSW